VLTRTSMSVELVHDGVALGELPGVHHVRRDGNRFSFEVDQAQLGAVIERLAALGVRSLESHPPTLEELFLRHYGHELAEAGLVT